MSNKKKAIADMTLAQREAALLRAQKALAVPTYRGLYLPLRDPRTPPRRPRTEFDEPTKRGLVAAASHELIEPAMRKRIIEKMAGDAVVGRKRRADQRKRGVLGNIAREENKKGYDDPRTLKELIADFVGPPDAKPLELFWAFRDELREWSESEVKDGEHKGKPIFNYTRRNGTPGKLKYKYFCALRPKTRRRK